MAALEVVTRCQYTDRLKGFKGKGDAAAVGQLLQAAQQDLQTIVDEMGALRDLTRQLPGRHCYLFRHQLKRQRSGDCVTLRWRLSDGRHIRWSEVQARIAALPAPVRQWYGEAQAAALYLNAREKTVRAECRHLTQLLTELAQIEAPAATGPSAGERP